MPKLKLIEDDSEEEEIVFKTNNEFAQKYEKWREKEELHKLEQKYGPQALNSEGAESSDSDDDSLEPPEVSEEMEAQFLKTLALLKTKDQRIYDPNYEFFDKNEEGNVKDKDTKPKEKTLSFADSDEEDDDNDGAIFSVEKKAVEVTDKPIEQQTKKALEEGKLKEYLIGKVEHLDGEVEKDLAPLKALWSDPKLSKEEAFLRDYILNKRYLEAGGAGEGRVEAEAEGQAGAEGQGRGEARLRDDAALEEDARLVEEQHRFERAYNFRYEEPDTEYLKRYPRTVVGAGAGAGSAEAEPYVRPKDQRRARRRAERAARKLREKQAKREELARLRAFKLREIRDKLDQIRQVTGNERLPFDEQELESDFDPEEHDRRMRELFDERYYGCADDTKPEFPDLDQELDIENWEQDEDEDEGEDGEQRGQRAEGGEGREPHCEDEDFNMDAEAEAEGGARAGAGSAGGGGGRRARRRRARLERLLGGGGAAGRAPYVPGAGGGAGGGRTYAQHMEEYYRLECEDVIGGDLPTRFKYRDVPPNDYGLSVEEILLADDKELTQWVPLKRVVKLRPARLERADLLAFRQRAADERLKRRLLPSLYRDLPPEPDIVVPVQEKVKKKKAKTDPEEVERNDTEFDQQIDAGNGGNGAPLGGDFEGQDARVSLKKKKKKKRDVPEEVNGVENTRTAEENLAKVNGSESNEIPSVSGDTSLRVDGEEISKRKKKKKNKKDRSAADLREDDLQRGNPKRKLDASLANEVPSKKQKIDHGMDTGDRVTVKNKKINKNKKFKNNKSKDNASDNPLSKISDERLKAYGLNPKKYRSFLKYKKF